MKKYPIFAAFVGLCVLVLVTFTVLAVLAFQKHQQARRDLDRAASRLSVARSLEPAPTEENLAAAQQNLDQLLTALREQIESAQGDLGGIQSEPPVNGNQLFFALDAYADELRLIARNVVPIFTPEEEQGTRRMQVPGDFENYTFGFDRYLRGEGGGRPPAEELVPIVHFQKEIMNYLLRQLFDVRPVELVAVKREDAREVFRRRNQTAEEVAAQAQATQRRGAARREQVADEFNPGGQTLRVENVVETLAFSVTFRGYTQNLRPFLRAIEGAELPLVVRSVTVRPLEESVTVAPNQPGQASTNPFDQLFGPSTPAPQAAATAPAEEDEAEDPQIPVVTQNLAEITVVVEYVDIEIAPDAEPLTVDDVLTPDEEA